MRKIFADPKIGFAGGRVDLFDPTDIPMTISASDQPELINPQTFIAGGALLGANMMFRRRVLEQIGGFDPDLGPGSRFRSGSDVDALIRASFAGWCGLYSPDVTVSHHHGRKAEDRRALMRRYMLGKGAYQAKFLLNAKTRAIVLPIVIDNCYRSARKAVSESYYRRWLMWEMQGFADYLAYRLRKRIAIGWRSERPNDFADDQSG